MQDKVTVWHHVERILLNAFLCVGCGLGFGAIAGSGVIPIIGTYYGGIAGLILGVACAPIVLPLVHRRHLRTVWLWLSLPPLVLCVACMFADWIALSTPSARSLSSITMYVSLLGSLFLFIGGAIVLHLVCPAVWPPVPAGICASCGYSLEGLDSAVCPECGSMPKYCAENAACPSCGYSFVGLDTSVCPECGVDYEAEYAGG